MMHTHSVWSNIVYGVMPHPAVMTTTWNPMTCLKKRRWLVRGTSGSASKVCSLVAHPLPSPRAGEVGGTFVAHPSPPQGQERWEALLWRVFCLCLLLLSSRPGADRGCGEVPVCSEACRGAGQEEPTGAAGGEGGWLGGWLGGDSSS